MMPPPAGSRVLCLIVAGFLLNNRLNVSRADDVVTFTEQEIRRLSQHSPLPPPPIDSTNRVSNNPAAAQLGQFLFFDKRLSNNGKISCASCHDPAKGLADGKTIAQGMQLGTRHAPSLWNVAYNRWYFWDGRADSIWAQALHPLEGAAEMGCDRLTVAHAIYKDEKLRRAYEQLFSTLPSLPDVKRFPAAARPGMGGTKDALSDAWCVMSAEDQDAVTLILVNVSKSLAAYVRKFVSRHAPFDTFIEGLESGDAKKRATLSTSAQRGAQLFVGKANCRLCHSGPNFSDGEFHDTRVPPLDGSQPKDPGRFAGVDLVLADPFNAASKFSDDPSPRARANIEFLTNVQENWGRFKTPSLRNVALTAPYMHQGQFAKLEDVIHYYSTLDRALPPGHHQESILKPINLSDQESADLLAFLRSLTDEKIDPALLQPPSSPLLDPRSSRETKSKH